MEKKSMKMVLEEGMEKRVPLAIVFAVVLQAATVVWWASAKERDVSFLEQRVVKLETIGQTDNIVQAQMMDRLARIEERLNAQLRVLDQIEKQTNTSHR